MNAVTVTTRVDEADVNYIFGLLSGHAYGLRQEVFTTLLKSFARHLKQHLDPNDGPITNTRRIRRHLRNLEFGIAPRLTRVATDNPGNPDDAIDSHIAV